MLSVEEAFRRVWLTVAPLPTERVPLAAAAGRVLREMLAADRPFPPFDRVTMDGVALRFAALATGQTAFRIERTQLAGQPAAPLSDAASCVEIMTGAALPPGADTVVRYEDLQLGIDNAGNRTATVLTLPPQVGHNVHPRASDCPAGVPLLLPGTGLGAPEIAVAATVGAGEVLVSRRPRVAVVSTGDELVDIGTTPAPHQIRRSNAPMLAAAARACGALVSEFHLPDNEAALAAGLPTILTAHDVVLLSGGVSKGKADFLPSSLRAAGCEQLLHEISQRPGKPLWVGRHAGGAVVFGLPGNPVSTFVTFHRYAASWLRAVQQPEAPPLPTPMEWAELAAAVDFRPALTYFLLVRLESSPDGRWRAWPVYPNSSGDMTSLLPAHGFLELPAEQAHFPAGGAWPLWRFR